jgi:hypothetical protein
MKDEEEDLEIDEDGRIKGEIAECEEIEVDEDPHYEDPNYWDVDKEDWESYLEWEMNHEDEVIW